MIGPEPYSSEIGLARGDKNISFLSFSHCLCGRHEVTEFFVLEVVGFLKVVPQFCGGRPLGFASAAVDWTCLWRDLAMSFRFVSREFDPAFERPNALWVASNWA